MIHQFYPKQYKYAQHKTISKKVNSNRNAQQSSLLQIESQSLQQYKISASNLSKPISTTNKINTSESKGGSSFLLDSPSQIDNLKGLQIQNDIITIKLKGYEFQKELAQLYQVLEKQKQLKVNLTIDITFKYQHVIPIFEQYMGYIAPYVVYLKWKINDLSSCGHYSKYIKNIMVQFTSLYKLDLEFSNRYPFNETNMTSILEGISSIQNLKILFFNIASLTDENRDTFNQLDDIINFGLLNSDTIEIFESNILIVDEESTIFPKLSNIQIFLTEKLANSIKIQLQLVDNKRQQITQISFDDEMIEYFNEAAYMSHIKLMQSFFEACLNLPYLTKLDMNVNSFENESITQRGVLLQQQSHKRFSEVLLIVGFTNKLENFFSFNPKQILFDLWID